MGGSSQGRWRRQSAGARPAVARARGGRGQRLAGGRFDERVAALERALGVVRGEREGEPAQLPRVALAGIQERRLDLALEHERAPLGQGALGLQAPARAGARLAQLLVQAGALAGEVLGGGAGERGEQAGSREHRPAAVISQPRRGGRQARPRQDRRVRP